MKPSSVQQTVRRSAAAGTARRLFAYVRSFPAALLMSIGFGILSGLTALIAPRLIGRIIDDFAQSGQTVPDGLTQRLLLLLGTFLLGALFHWLLSVFAIRLAVLTAARIRAEAFERLSGLSLSVIDTHPAGDFVSRLINDADAIHDGLSQVLIQLGAGSVTLVGALVIMFRLAPGVALAALAVTPLCFVVTALINRNSRAMYRKQAAAAGRINAFADEAIEGQTVLRSFGAEEAFCADFARLNADLYVVGQKAQFYASLTNPGTRFVNNIAYILVGIIACAIGLRGGISIGVISSLLSYVLQFAKPINEFSAVSSQFQNALSGSERLFELIDTPQEDLREEAPALEVTGGSVVFREVDFSYTSDRPLIQNLNLTVPAGAKIAIVGPTGAGKTTLVNLLMNFYDIDRGTILIDDVDIQAVSVASLRQSFGMVLQDSWLFSGTVRNNIAYGRADASEEAVVEAAKAAHAHDFIMRLPAGYETLLTGAGAALSAGEKQLLTIARAFLTRPQILILDEATSNIDTRTEQLIQQAFDRMMEGKTAFIIAHRLSTVREADRILVLGNGRIVQQGRHEELVAEDGLYQDMYNSQYEYVNVD